MSPIKPLVDQLGRVHNNLRISVTDRCNLRCSYCMPTDVQFQAREELLTFEEITRFVKIVAGMGVNRLRLTGGEPLVRRGIPQLVQRLKSIDGIKDLALTTNAVLLQGLAQELRDAGLDRLNISLDTLDEESFQKLTFRKGIDQIKAGILKAKEVGFEKIRLNAVALAGTTEAQVVPLANFARENEMELRFIEFMPLDGDQLWQIKSVLTGERIREILEAEFGPLTLADRPNQSQPSLDYDFSDNRGRVGFINPVSQPFCQSCNRLRITSEGHVMNCLFSSSQWDVRPLLRNGDPDCDVEQLVRDCVLAKKKQRGSDDEEFGRPEKAMYGIGG